MDLAEVGRRVVPGRFGSPRNSWVWGQWQCVLEKEPADPEEPRDVWRELVRCTVGQVVRMDPEDADKVEEWIAVVAAVCMGLEAGTTAIGYD